MNICMQKVQHHDVHENKERFWATTTTQSAFFYVIVYTYEGIQNERQSKISLIYFCGCIVTIEKYAQTYLQVPIVKKQKSLQNSE